MIRYILKEIIPALEEQLESKSTYNEMFDEYCFENVKESKLLESGFEYDENSSETLPSYRNENLVAYYMGNVLYMYSIIM